jgi:hypothetical protein
MGNYEKKILVILTFCQIKSYCDFAKIETSLLEGDIQSGSFTEKMTLDPDCGVNCMVACREPRGKQKKGPMLQVPSTIMGVGVGRKVCDTIRPSVATSESPQSL